MEFSICVNVDKGERMEPENHAAGDEIYDQAWTDEPFMNAIERALSPEGSWHKNRLVWAGDEVNPEDSSLDKVSEEQQKKYRLQMLLVEEEKNLYEVASEYFQKKVVLETVKDRSLQYLINHTKKEYVDMNKLPEEIEGQTTSIHPLPYLTCSKYREYGFSIEFTGRWTADSISMERELPAGYMEIQPDFVNG